MRKMENTIVKEAKKLSLRNNKNPSKNLPSLFFFTDRKKFVDIFSVIKSLPECVGIVVREYDLDKKSRLLFALRVKKLAGKKMVLIGKDLKIALASGANGVHFSDLDFSECKYFHCKKFAKKDFIFTYACHKFGAIKKADKNNWHAIFYSPIFKTDSHPDSKPIGILNLAKIARMINTPIYALGGINEKNYRLLKNCKISGFAGISLFKDY